MKQTPSNLIKKDNQDDKCMKYNTMNDIPKGNKHTVYFEKQTEYKTQIEGGFFILQPFHFSRQYSIEKENSKRPEFGRGLKQSSDKRVLFQNLKLAWTHLCYLIVRNFALYANIPQSYKAFDNIEAVDCKVQLVLLCIMSRCTFLLAKKYTAL